MVGERMFQQKILGRTIGRRLLVFEFSHQLPETGQGVERSQIRIILGPFGDGHAAHAGAFEAVQGPFGLPPGAHNHRPRCKECRGFRHRA